MSLSSFFTGLQTVFEPVTNFLTTTTTDPVTGAVTRGVHPTVAAMLIGGIAGIFEPSEYDKERDRLRAQRESEAVDRKRRNENLQVGGLRLPEPASRANQFLNNPILQRRQRRPQGAVEDPIEQMQQGLLQRY